MDTNQNPGSMLLLTRLAKIVYKSSTEELLGMRLRHFMTLVYLRENQGSQQQVMCDMLGMDANNLVLLLNSLEETGYIRRVRDPADRRRHLVEMTAEGRRALERAERARESIEDQVLAGLDSEERATLHDLLLRAVRAAALPEERQPA